MSSIKHDDDGLLESCEWMARIAGSQLEGTFAVNESKPDAMMSVRLRAADWKGSIDVTLEPSGDGTRLHARMELHADGFTALMIAPVVTKVIGDAFPARLEEFGRLLEAD